MRREIGGDLPLVFQPLLIALLHEAEDPRRQRPEALGREPQRAIGLALEILPGC